jgi:erythromycin esterase-like protein
MSRAALDTLRHAAIWFEPTTDGFDPLVESIGDARLVLIGEASQFDAVFHIDETCPRTARNLVGR